MDNLVIVNKDLLRKYRENNGLTQKVMGNILGMSAQFYWQIESGYINPTLKIAQNIKAVLKIFFAMTSAL